MWVHVFIFCQTMILTYHFSFYNLKFALQTVYLNHIYSLGKIY